MGAGHPSGPFSKLFITQSILEGLAITLLLGQTDQVDHNVQLFIDADGITVPVLDSLRDPLDTRGFPWMRLLECLIGAEVVAGLGAEIFIVDNALSEEAAMRYEAITLAIFRINLEILAYKIENLLDHAGDFIHLLHIGIQLGVDDVQGDKACFAIVNVDFQFLPQQLFDF